MYPFFKKVTILRNTKSYLYIRQLNEMLFIQFLFKNLNVNTLKGMF